MMSYPNGVAYITFSNNQISNYQSIFKNHMIYKQCKQCIVQCTVQSAMYNVQCTDMTTYVLTLKNIEDDCVDFSFSFVPGRET